MTMDLNKDHFFASIETENDCLTERVVSLETENFRLSQQLSEAEKALDKQRKFHRKFAEDVVVSEKIRNQDFKEEKRSLTERNKTLTNENRQLTKDVSFYKGAYEELAKDVEPACCSQSPQRTVKNRCLSASAPSESGRSSKSVATSMMIATGTSQFNSSACSHKSSKVLSKISEKLLLENKKLKAKLDNLNTSIRGLKAKNQQLEKFKKKIDNKKFKFAQDSDELTKLIESTKTKNKSIFNPKVLARLGELSEYKAEL